MPEPTPTTLEELRDWHAWRQGWEFKHGSWWHEKLHGPICDHPIADTIDAAVLAFPEGWVWERGPHRCHLRRHGVSRRHGASGEVVHVFASIEIAGHTPAAIRRDLLALARLAWIAEGACP